MVLMVEFLFWRASIKAEVKKISVKMLTKWTTNFSALRHAKLLLRFRIEKIFSGKTWSSKTNSKTKNWT